MIMRGLYNIPLGAVFPAPISFKHNPFAAAALMAIGSAAMGATQSAMNNHAASNLNADNRDFQREMWEKQSAYNTQEAQIAREHQQSLLTQEQNWQEQMYNLYNSPSAMMRQYQEAGINPYLVDASHGFGSSMNSPSAPGAAQATAPSVGTPQTYMPDYSPLVSGLSNAAQLYLQSKQINANVANQSAKTLSEAADAYTKLRGHGMSSDDAKSLVMPYFKGTQGMDADSDKFFGLLNLEYERNSLSNQLSSLQLSIEREFGRTERADKIMNMEQQFSVMAAEIGRMAVQNKFDESAIDRMASEIARNFAAAGLDAANTDLIRGSMDFLINSAQYQARLDWFNQATAEGEYNIRKPVYEAASTGAGQTAEVVDYYTGKVVDKVGKLMKVNIGVSKSSSTSRGYTNSWIWNGNQFVGGPKFP